MELYFIALEKKSCFTFINNLLYFIIATFNIIGALTMLIIEKKKDIKTLYNLGADQQFIQQIFMKEGFLITAIGAVCGLLIGLVVCLLQIQFHFITFDDQYVIPYYPIKLEVKDFVWILGVVMVIGFVAAIYPVRIFTKNDLVHEHD